MKTDNCLVGGETSCSSVKISGFFTPGTFQQYIISPARYVTPIPDGVDLAGAAPLMCGGIAVYTGLKRANAKSGDWVLVSGAGGGLGHLAIQYAKAMGARVLAVDAGSKGALCNELGAEAFIDFTKFSTDEELTAEVLKISKGGVQTVLMCSSNLRAYTQALGFLGFRGTLCCLGVPEGENPFGPKAMGPILNNELTIIGESCRSCLADMY
jgi:propanol-preferring alcohol dehydrogenase